MGSAMRRMGVYLGLLEDTERYEDYPESDEPVRAAAAPAQRQAGDARPAPVSQLAERRRQGGPAAAPASAQVTDLSRITTLHPTTYNDARAPRGRFNFCGDFE